MHSLPKPPVACQVPPASYSLPDVIPLYLPGGGINLLAGAPGVGKTALLAGILRELRDGRLIFGHQPLALPGIGIVNADRTWAKGCGLWFERTGYPEIKHYSLADDVDFNPKRLRKRHERTDLLANFADRLELPPGSLLNVDPLSLFLGGNLLDYESCMVACHEIRAYLRLRQYTLIGLGHTAKLKANKQDRYARMQDQLFGSTALAGFTDAQLYLASPLETGKSYYTLVWHPHGAKEEQHLLERDEQGLFVPYSGVDEGTRVQVLNLFPLTDDAVGFALLVELASAIPLSRATVKRTLDVLLERGTVARAGHGLYKRVTVN